MDRLEFYTVDYSESYSDSEYEIVDCENREKGYGLIEIAGDN